MKSRVAAEGRRGGVALRAAGLAPARGELLIAASSTRDGRFTSARMADLVPSAEVRFELLVNEGGGGSFRRRQAIPPPPTPKKKRKRPPLLALVRCGKGVCPFHVTTAASRAHASMPGSGRERAVEVAPLLEPPLGRPPALLRADRRAARAAARDRRGRAGRGSSIERPCVLITDARDDVGPMLASTFPPTASFPRRKINVIPSRASLKFDCRFPRGSGELVLRDRRGARQ